MSAAQIYSQYISDYEDAAKKHNRSARAYQNTTDYYGGPTRGQSTDGQQLGLYSVPYVERNVVKKGTAQDFQNAYAAAGDIGRHEGVVGQFMPDKDANGQDMETGSWSMREGQDRNAFRNSDGGYFMDVGNGFAAARTGGKPTGQFVTERIGGDAEQAQTMLSSGKYKDVKHGDNGVNENGDPMGYIDVTYEQMKFPDQPGEFNAKKPNLSMAQLREIANPTPTMAEAEREGVNDVGLIESARQKFMSAKPGLISSSR